MDFGDNLRRLRERAQLTQEALASKLKLKRPTPISLWEGPRKSTVPKPATITRLARALDCEPWELLQGVRTEYDSLRVGDPACQAVGVQRASNLHTQEGGATYDSNAARVLAHELPKDFDRLRKLADTLISEIQDVADRFARFVADTTAASTDRLHHRPARSRTRRKAG